jgi:cytochrome c-type biogenesis protein CcmH
MALEPVQVAWRPRRVGKANGSGLRPARWQAPRAHPLHPAPQAGEDKSICLPPLARKGRVGAGGHGAQERAFAHPTSDSSRSNSAPRIPGCYAFLAMLVMLATFISFAHAVTPDEVLSDPALETRARAISQLLRCVVCQNQSIDDSNAPLAHDLRVLVRERLTSGDTDEQAVDFIVSRYGNFVLLNPPVQLNTLTLWLGPALFVLIAALGFGQYVRRRSIDRTVQAPVALTTTEQKRIDELLGERNST